MVTIPGGDADRGDLAAAPDVGQPAADHDTERADGAGDQGKGADLGGREVPFGAEELVRELAGGRGEQGVEESRRRPAGQAGAAGRTEKRRGGEAEGRDVKRRLSGSRRLALAITGNASRPPAKSHRQPRTPRSARGSAMVASPAPNPMLSVSTATAQARDPAGISSAAMTPVSTRAPATSATASTWLAVSHARDGARAPSRCQQRAGRGRDQQDTAPALPVGQGEQAHGEDDVDADDAERDSLTRTADFELPRRVGHGERQQGPEIADDDRQGGQGGEHHRGPAIEPMGRCPPGHGRIRAYPPDGQPEG